MLRGVTDPDPKSFLALLAPESRNALTGRLTQQAYEKGQFIINHQDENDDLFILMSGRAEVRVFSAEGKIVAFRSIRPGDIFGELAAIDAMPRSASVIAVEPTITGALTQAAFRRWVTEDETHTWAMLRHLARQVRTVTSQITEFRLYSAYERLIFELRNLAQSVPQTDGAIEMPGAPSNQELSILIGSHREAVSRDMSKLAGDGILKRRGRTLVILKPEQLTEMAAAIEEEN